jgi:NitT/TauT family transport system substrate-binding protein/putative hydroxymethylpyrimidine transport system substrate-binding protein
MAAAGCGGNGGAEPGASQEATLVLDFQPNAVHAGIYTAMRRGWYADEGLDLTVREPSSSTDAPKLLEAGRTDFAIMDVHDLALARERGFDLVGVGAIVERPLAAVIARDRTTVRSPADLSGRTVGVTGLPSDDAVLDSVLEPAGVDPSSVDRVTIGFQAVAALAAGRIDAATAFWNAEGVTLRRRGVPIRVFRVDDYGAPRYPELVLVTSRQTLQDDPALVDAAVRATNRGYEAVVADPAVGLDDLLAEASGLDPAEQKAQLDALMAAHAFEPVGALDRDRLEAWARWEVAHGIVEERPAVDSAFDLG